MTIVSKSSTNPHFCHLLCSFEFLCLSINLLSHHIHVFEPFREHFQYFLTNLRDSRQVCHQVILVYEFQGSGWKWALSENRPKIVVNTSDHQSIPLTKTSAALLCNKVKLRKLPTYHYQKLPLPISFCTYPALLHRPAILLKQVLAIFWPMRLLDQNSRPNFRLDWRSPEVFFVRSEG